MLIPFYLPAIFLVFSIKKTISKDLHADRYGEVIFSHVVFRHGDRMPIELYPNDPNKVSDFPYELSQLTNIGKTQAYELGCWLRRRYSHLLSSAYKSDEIYVESTDLDRTLMSAQCNLAGLYRPIENQEWNHDIHWQPIPIHTVPIDKDMILGASSTVRCPLYDLEMSTVLDYPDIKEFKDKMKDVYDYITEKSGINAYDFENTVKLSDTLEIENRYNLTLPDWTRSVYPDPLRMIGYYHFLLPTHSHLLQRLKVGPLLGDMVGHFLQKRDGTLTPNRKLWMYSAHDMTISSILNTFGSFELHQPPYASALLLELRIKNDEHFVTMFYRNSTTREPVLLTVKGCDTLCPLDQFVSLTEPLIPNDWLQECNSVSMVAARMPSNTVLVILAVIVSSLVILFVSVTTCWMRKQPKIWLNDIRPPGLPTAKCKEVIISSK